MLMNPTANSGDTRVAGSTPGLETFPGVKKDIKLTHGNPLHSFTLTMRKQKEKLRKQYHSPSQQKE